MPTFPPLQGSLMHRCGLVLVVAATIALPPRLESQEPAAPVLEPLFAIVSDGRWGLINRTGRVVVAPRYDGLVMQPSAHVRALKDLHTLTSDDVYTGAADLPIALNAGWT